MNLISIIIGINFLSSTLNFYVVSEKSVSISQYGRKNYFKKTILENYFWISQNSFLKYLENSKIK